jgi:hypothetical protein
VQDRRLELPGRRPFLWRCGQGPYFASVLPFLVRVQRLLRTMEGLKIGEPDGPEDLHVG